MDGHMNVMPQGLRWLIISSAIIAVSMAPARATSTSAMEPERLSVQRPLMADLGDIAIGFEENGGQAPEEVRYRVRGGSWTMELTDSGPTMTLRRSDGDRSRLSMRLVDGNPRMEPQGVDRLPGRIHYIRGGSGGSRTLTVDRYAAVHSRMPSGAWIWRCMPLTDASSTTSSCPWR